MNTIDLLDKLNLPTRIGLEGDEALFNQQVIMDAYLSAASVNTNRQLLGGDGSANASDARSFDGMFNLNSASPEMPKGNMNIDLFKAYGQDTQEAVCDSDLNDTRIVVDLMKLKDYPLADLYEAKTNILQCQEGSSQGETESESYTKLEAELNRATQKPSRKGKKKVDKSNISEFVAEERRRLMKKLDSCEMDRTVYKRRVKNNKKDPKVSADNYRGSKYWGVSKNKSKWQVCLVSEYSLIKI
jgi:hypothetical protein